jgi:hypothetical protein
VSDRAGRDRLLNSRWGFESNCFVCEERDDSGLRIPFFHDRDDDAVVAVVLHRPHLRHTIAITLAVGSVLFCINQLDVVLRGDATAMVWAKSAVTYLVRFAVSNAGVLVGSRRAPE